jgi:hypothetical protein
MDAERAAGPKTACSPAPQDGAPGLPRGVTGSLVLKRTVLPITVVGFSIQVTYRFPFGLSRRPTQT